MLTVIVILSIVIIILSLIIIGICAYCMSVLQALEDIIRRIK